MEIEEPESGAQLRGAPESRAAISSPRREPYWPFMRLVTPDREAENDRGCVLREGASPLTQNLRAGPLVYTSTPDDGLKRGRARGA